MSVYVDAQVMKEGGIVVGAIDVMVPGFGIYVVKGVNDAKNAVNFTTKSMGSGSKNKREKIGIKMFTKLLYGRLVWEQSENE